MAPWWHTGLLLFVVLGVATTGTVLGDQGAAPAPAAGSRVTAIYAPMIAVQWLLVLYVSRIGRPRSALPALLGARWRGLRDAGGDLALAATIWLAVEGTEHALFRVGGAAGASVSSLLPRTAGEHVAWIAVAASAGFCEEVVYRGYLRAQLAAFTRRPLLALVLQAVLFGIAHADQGPAGVVRVGFYGLLFGLLAEYRRSLIPGILGHVGVDVASSLLR